MTAEPVPEQADETDETAAESLDELLDRQGGVLSRAQAIAAGITPGTIEGHVKGARWKRVLPGVYATYTGSLSYEARVWAAVLYAGKGAVASHETAARLWGIGHGDEDTLIHIAVPTERRVAPQEGLRIHRSRRAEEASHPVATPPRTRVEETVVDLVDAARTFDEALAVIMRAAQRRKTTIGRIWAAMTQRNRLRWRRELIAPMNDVADGAQSMLEYRYVRDVERAHGLPRGRRQRRWTLDGKSRYLDGRLEKYRTRIELDGRIGHVEDGAFRDMQRDNAGAVSGDATLRYGWLDVTTRACEAAGQVGAVLQRNGWRGAPKRCGPNCRLPIP